MYTGYICTLGLGASGGKVCQYVHWLYMYTGPRGIRRRCMSLYITGYICIPAVMSTLRPLLQSCDSTHTIRLIELLRVFVSGNKSRCDAVMTTLSAILPLYPPLTTPTLEYLRQIVRGNQTLTNIYQQLNAKVAHLCKL